MESRKNKILSGISELRRRRPSLAYCKLIDREQCFTAGKAVQPVA